VIVCICCGLTREERPEDAGQWYMVQEGHGGTRHETY
jgi:hypothetical protein